MYALLIMLRLQAFFHIVCAEISLTLTLKFIVTVLPISITGKLNFKIFVALDVKLAPAGLDVTEPATKSTASSKVSVT